MLDILAVRNFTNILTLVPFESVITEDFNFLFYIFSIPQISCNKQCYNHKIQMLFLHFPYFFLVFYNSKCSDYKTTNQLRIFVLIKIKIG